jgi:hypothetical protein
MPVLAIIAHISINMLISADYYARRLRQLQPKKDRIRHAFEIATLNPIIDI